jgi:hypothetical protein
MNMLGVPKYTVNSDAEVEGVKETGIEEEA